MTAAAPSLRGAAARRPRLDAAFLLAPATASVLLVLVLPLLLLLRYSFNHFEPGQFMVEALTAENYVKFFSDPITATSCW